MECVRWRVTTKASKSHRHLDNSADTHGLTSISIKSKSDYSWPQIIPIWGLLCEYEKQIYIKPGLPIACNGGVRGKEEWGIEMKWYLHEPDRMHMNCSLHWNALEQHGYPAMLLLLLHREDLLWSVRHLSQELRVAMVHAMQNVGVFSVEARWSSGRWSNHSIVEWWRFLAMP